MDQIEISTCVCVCFYPATCWPFRTAEQTRPRFDVQVANQSSLMKKKKDEIIARGRGNNFCLRKNNTSIHNSVLIRNVKELI